MVFSPEAVLEGLTEPQRRAATTIDGPLLVLAGAGSGKTRNYWTRRGVYDCQWHPGVETILAITRLPTRRPMK